MKDKLQKLEKKVQEIHTAKIRTETQLEELRNRRDALLKQLESLNIDPATLDDQIKALRQQIEENLENIEAQIPKDL